jgi:hypothetical protein
MEVSVKLRPDAAESLQAPAARSSPEIDRIAKALAAVGVSLQPMHPGEGDPELRTWFRVVVHDESTTERVLRALRASSAVESAYAKPPDEAPL